MFYSKAILAATYKNAKPGIRTDAHEKSESHRFKTEYLFKHKKIPKALYLSRLLQHFLIIQTLEVQLQNLSEISKSEINAFFALSYLERLWRTLGIESDLKQLGYDSSNINDNAIAPTTKNYLQNIQILPPKSLLAHFLLHIVGFMHGGNIIRKKYIEPSNNLTEYQISTHQYDFSSAAIFLSLEPNATLAVYQNMMQQIDKISLNTDEYNEILMQCTDVYEIMAKIYDDLCNIHSKKQFSYSLLAAISICIIIAGFTLGLLMPMINSKEWFNYSN